MKFLSDLFSGSHGAGFHAQGVPIEKGLGPNDISNTLGNIGLNQQQTEGALGQQQAFVNALNGQNGLQHQSSVYNQQQGLADQLGEMSRGGGPNPALDQLNQTTAQNIQNQAAMAASQRGASQNPALLARMAGQQGSSAQQNAAGQAATLRSQQQLAATQALQQQQGMMAGLAGQQVGQQQQGLGALNAFSQGAQGLNNQLYGTQLGALGQYNNANVNMQSNLNNTNASIAKGNQQSQSDLFGGLLGGLGTIFMADGGQAPLDPTVKAPSALDDTSPQSTAAKFLAGAQNGMKGGGNAIGQGIGTAFNSIIGNTPTNKAGGEFEKQYGDEFLTEGHLAKGGMTQAISDANQLTSDAPYYLRDALKKALNGSFGRKGLSEPVPYKDQVDEEEESKKYASGGKAKSYKRGGHVPEKPKLPGNDLRNDTVPAWLSPGEIVIPNSITAHPQAAEKSAEFVAAILAKKGMR